MTDLKKVTEKLIWYRSDEYRSFYNSLPPVLKQAEINNRKKLVNKAQKIVESERFLLENPLNDLESYLDTLGLSPKDEE